MGFANQPDFFSHPEPFTAWEKLENKPLDMCWNFGKKSYLQFFSTNKEVYYELHLEECDDAFLDRVRDKCMEQSGRITFSYRWREDGFEEVNNRS